MAFLDIQTKLLFSYLNKGIFLQLDFSVQAQLTHDCLWKKRRLLDIHFYLM